MITSYKQLRQVVDTTVANTKITDVHTHLYSPCFKDMLLWGIDELLNYHYLVAETFRWLNIPYEDFWSMDKKAQANLIWKTLFEDNSPYSEACRGVLTTLKKLGLDVGSRDIDSYRSFFAGFSVEDYVDRVFEVSGVEKVIMTNNPFDQEERDIWLNSYVPDSRFKAALRIDPLLIDTCNALNKLKDWGYNIGDELNDNTYKEVIRFLSEWIERMDALYVAASLPYDFCFPDDSVSTKIIENCILPVCREYNIPFALMIGVKRLINPDLKLAGDGVGKGSIESVEYLCAKYPHNKFMVTMLSRENQHELAVSARKFRNLLVFGCWWFLNNPSLIDEITRMRFELLGVSVIPQHSDARVLDQLIYKWEHSKNIIADVLYDKYKDLMDTGWRISEDEIERDVQKLFGGNFWTFLSAKF
ncbi:glucuronate isomerase [Xylanivirga thermophila]|uniref:glucuronate isomerase n=1 Tax=Xylanivirga thermophila TaxID=2496273 RepID=UPI00101D07E0|nr:glucuronate isomerase [Xylanivirga thermophila]